MIRMDFQKDLKEKPTPTTQGTLLGVSQYLSVNANEVPLHCEMGTGSSCVGLKPTVYPKFVTTE